MAEKQTEIKIVSGVVIGPGKDGLPGDIVTVEEGLAKQLIAAGAARAVEAKKGANKADASNKAE